ncbi:hypothetical protein [Dongia sp.]|jgi:hypothetical protein|uniref:hypothetical protein n=1 Tax=Dongia sp. TaxID=1977262 RepID=UPI0035ADEABC
MAFGVILGVLLCLSGPLLGYAALKVTQSFFAYTAICLLTNFVGGMVLARRLDTRAYFCSGAIAFPQAYFSLGLVGASAWTGQLGSIAVFSVVWIATAFVGIAAYLWRKNRRLRADKPA